MADNHSSNGSNNGHLNGNHNSESSDGPDWIPTHEIIPEEIWSQIRRDYDLTGRELDVVKRFFHADSEASAAYTLGIAVNTVHYHTKNIYRKFNVHDQRELLLRIVAEYLVGASPE